MKELNSKRLFIFDMDGTIYLGDKVFDYAVNFIKNLKNDGKKVLFFTNNASHSKSFYYNKLTKLGFNPQLSEIITSGDVTIQFLNHHRKGQSVYLVGTDELISDFINSSILLDNNARIVVTSFDTTITYEKLNNACRLIRNGAEYLSTHPDFNCPTETGFIPDSGAIAAFVTASTGVVPTYFGKPYPQTIDMICEVTGESRENMCIFGDRIYTDIALGKRHGVTSVLVLSGETQKEDLDKVDIEVYPDFVYLSLKEVNDSMY